MNSQNLNQYDDNKENMPNEQNLQQNMFQIGSQVTENDQNKVEGQKKNNKRTLKTLYTDFDKQKSFQSLIDSLSVILQDIGLEDKNQKDCSLQMSQNEQNELNGILKDLRIEENQLKEFKMSCHKNIDNFDKEQDMLLNLQRICKKLQKLRFEDQYDDITKFDIQQDEINGLNEQIKKLVLSKNDEIKKLITSIQQLDKTISDFQENLKNLVQNQKSNDLNNQSQLQQIDSQKLRKDLKFVIIGDKKIELSDMQKKIINAPLNQSLLVQSVAGSGKTTTMAIRVQKMIQDGIKPNEMMILTFNITAGQQFIKILSKVMKNSEIISELKIGNIDKIIYQYFKDGTIQQNHQISQKEHQKMFNEYLKTEEGKDILNQYKYIIFDEFQDISDIQFEMLELFINNGSYITLIGDENQAIYGWRGGFSKQTQEKIKNIDFQRLNLLENRRSDKIIIDLANEIIQNDGQDKMIAISEYYGQKINIQKHDNLKNQRKTICDQIEQLREQGVSFGKIAILAFTNKHLIQFENEFSKRKINYMIDATVNNISISGIRENDDDWENKVSLCTMHRSKGLEWEYVFIISCNDEIIPGKIKDQDHKSMQEKRNLMYVAVTRCSKNLCISFLSSYKKKCSRFISKPIQNSKISDKLFNLNELKKNDIVFKHEPFDKNTQPNFESIQFLINNLDHINYNELRSKGLIYYDIQEQYFAIDEEQEQISLNPQIFKCQFELDWAHFLKLVFIELFLQESGIKKINKLDVYTDKYTQLNKDISGDDSYNSYKKEKNDRLQQFYQQYKDKNLDIKKDFKALYEISKTYMYNYNRYRLQHNKLAKVIFRKQLFSGKTKLYKNLVKGVKKFTENFQFEESDVKYQHCIVNTEYQFECYIDLIIKDTIIMVKNEEQSVEDTLILLYWAALYMKQYLGLINDEIDEKIIDEKIKKYTINKIAVYNALKQTYVAFNIEGFYEKIDEYLQYFSSLRKGERDYKETDENFYFFFNYKQDRFDI